MRAAFLSRLEPAPIIRSTDCAIDFKARNRSDLKTFVAAIAPAPLLREDCAMLFRTADLEAIFAGERTLAFRRWKRPTVKVGGTVRTQMGMVGIDAIEPIAPADVTDAEAVAAGYRDAAGVVAMFEAQEGQCYRIRLHPAGPDPRDALREAPPTPEEIEKITKRLAKLDGAEPWTAAVLELIRAKPGVVSTALAEVVGLPRDAFKERVRKLKGLGLTISLEVGYRLSPRGEAVLAAL